MTHHSWTRINWGVIGQVLCVYMSYICILREVFVLVSQLLVSSYSLYYPRGTCAIFWAGGETARRVNIPPSTCWPSNWGIPAHDRASASAAEADDCSVPLLFWFGSDKHRLSPAAWSPGHNSLSTEEGEGTGVGWRNRKVGHISKVLLKITALSVACYRKWLQKVGHYQNKTAEAVYIFSMRIMKWNIFCQ